MVYNGILMETIGISVKYLLKNYWASIVFSAVIIYL